jgi:hypothetical protein
MASILFGTGISDIYSGYWELKVSGYRELVAIGG